MKTWEMTRTLYKVSDFVSWQRDRTLSLSPSFQRRPVWKPGAKSYLIDTVVRGLPIPIIFLREQSTDLSTFKPVREVVDGQQRIRTILSYVDPGCLIDYKKDNDFFTVQEVHNEELAGKTFSELSSDLKLRILDYQFSVHVFPSSIDDREVLQLFARLNATGVKLTSQELRNAEYFGILKTSAYALAAEQLPRWRHWKIFSEYNIARMEEVELVSEFVLLMLKGVTGKSQAALDKLYEDKNENYAERGEVEKRFRVVMDSIEDKLESQLVFLPFNSKTLFYSLFAAFYDAHFGLKSSLTKERIKPASAEFISRIKECGERIQVKTAPEKVMEAVARRTTHVSSRNAILDYLLNK